jgi:hypothetical protein
MLLLGGDMLMLLLLLLSMLLLLLATGRRTLLERQALLPCQALIWTDLWLFCACNKAALCLKWL